MRAVRAWVLVLFLARMAGAAQCGDVTYTGGGVAGGTASGDSVELYENCADFDTVNTGRINLHGRIKIGDSWTFGNASATTFLLDLSPAITVSAASQTISLLGSTAVLTQTVNPVTGILNVISTGATVQSSTNAVRPLGMSNVAATATIAGLDCGGGACAIGTVGQINGFRNQTTASVTGGSTTMTVTNFSGFRDEPTFAANTAGGTLTITTRHGLHVLDPTVTATGTVSIATNTGVEIDPQTSGTTVYGIRVKAQATGTNIFPLAFGEHTITGTVASGEGVIGVETGAPDRLYYKNESGNIWRMGYTSALGTGTVLATVSGTTDYIPFGYKGAANATEATIQISGPGNVTFFAMTCGLSAAPGGSSVRTMTFMKANGSASSNLTCTITGSATQCSVFPTSTDVVAATALLSIKDAVTVANAAAATGSCVLFFTVDAF